MTERDGMVGRTYLLRGDPVVVLARADWKAGGPRNVLVEREDGSRLVRPFRGLRRQAVAGAGHIGHVPLSASQPIRPKAGQ